MRTLIMNRLQWNMHCMLSFDRAFFFLLGYVGFISVLQGRCWDWVFWGARPSYLSEQFSYKNSAWQNYAWQSQVYRFKASDVGNVNVGVMKQTRRSCPDRPRKRLRRNLIRTPPIISCICKYLCRSNWTHTWSTPQGLRLPSGAERLGRRISALTCLASC